MNFILQEQILSSGLNSSFEKLADVEVDPLYKMIEKHYRSVFMVFVDYLLPLCRLKSIMSGNATVSFSVLVPFQKRSCNEGGSLTPSVKIPFFHNTFQCERKMSSKRDEQEVTERVHRFCANIVDLDQT